MWLQSVFACVFTIDAVITLFKLQKMVVNISEFVQHIAQAFVLGMVAYLVLVGSHAENSITQLNINLLKKSH